MTYEHRATYSPDDNKLRLHPCGRLSAEEYAAAKAHGFRWAPKQEQFIAPAWSPERADWLQSLCGDIEDDDSSLMERAEDRAERFEVYQENREQDAESARAQVARIADGIPLGQPILVGHHSERHARRDAKRIENGMRRAVKAWETAEYWSHRAAAAIRHAKYKERPDVRARRIKGIEADLRRVQKGDKESAASLALLDLIDKPEKWKPREDGAQECREWRAAWVAGRVRANVSHKNKHGYCWSLYDVLRLPVDDRSPDAPKMTIDEALTDARASFARATAYRQRWAEHCQMRLTYERAMLAESGGIVADRKPLEIGGAVQCPPWSPRGGWSYIVKVNRVTVTIRHQWSSGGTLFSHNEPLDSLRATMTRAEVEEARAAGRITEAENGTGFYLRPAPETTPQDPAPDSVPASDPAPAPQETSKPEAGTFQAMRETLRNGGVRAVSVAQLFPTPREIAARMVELADIRPGMRVLEPSAGTGALLGAMGGRMFAHNPEAGSVHACEINPDLARHLQRDFPLTSVRCVDFLDTVDEQGFDRIVMNPPFKDAEDVKHIIHAAKLLKPGGRLVALCAAGPRQQAVFEGIASHWEILPPGSFRAAGTGVNVALLTIDKKD